MSQNERQQDRQSNLPHRSRPSTTHPSQDSRFNAQAPVFDPNSSFTSFPSSSPYASPFPYPSISGAYHQGAASNFAPPYAPASGSLQTYPAPFQNSPAYGSAAYNSLPYGNNPRPPHFDQNRGQAAPFAPGGLGFRGQEFGYQQAEQYYGRGSNIPNTYEPRHDYQYQPHAPAASQPPFVQPDAGFGFYHNGVSQTNASSGSGSRSQQRGQGSERRGQWQPASGNEQFPNAHNNQGAPHQSMGQDPYAFPTEQVECDELGTLNVVTQYAHQLASEHSASDSGSAAYADPTDLKNDFGLRTGFNAGQGQAAQVATNFVAVKTRPPRLYVYEIKMVREYDQNGREKILKNRWCRQVIFDKLKANETSLQDLLTNQGCWVTDHDMIWSTKPLFGNTLPLTISGATNNNLGGKDIAYKDFRIHSVVVTERAGGLDLNKTVAELFRNAAETPTAEDDPSILVRGLNAFIVKHMQSQVDQRVLAKTSSNKFFDTAGTSLEFHNSTVRVLKGFFISIRPSMGISSLVLNVNPAFTPFFEQMTVQEYYDRLLHNFNAERYRPLPQLPDADLKSFESTLKNARVLIVQYGQNQQVQPQDRRIVSEVRLQHYGLEINVGDHRKKGQGRPDWRRAAHLAIEEFQPIRTVLSKTQQDEMIKEARLAPSENAKSTVTRGLGMIDVNSQFLANNQFTIGKALIKIPARFLAAPRPRYSNQPTGILPQNARWNLAKAAFVSRANIELCPVLNLTERQPNQADKAKIENGLIASMRTAFQVHGLGQDVQMPIEGPHFVSYDHSRAFETTLEGILKKLNPYGAKHHLIILPEHKKGYEAYAAIKRVGDLVTGIQTVCVTRDNMNKNKGAPGRDQQFASNVAMKFNLKGAEDNHHIAGNAFDSLLASPGGECDTIVLGADVAHPLNSASPGCPSIASVVGSTDRNFVKFPGSMRLQRGRQEFIEKLWDMVKERLIDWAEANGGKLPKRILFYRDGVSESQYDGIRQQEIPQLQRAYRLAKAYLEGDTDVYASEGDDPDDDSKSKAGKPDRGSQKRASSPNAEAMLKLKIAEDKTTPPSIPTKVQAIEMLRKSKEDFKLTYIVVGKRHNTRFFPTSDRETFSNSKGVVNGNVKPGLLVEKIVTHPYSNDFYLQSHEPLAGTGRAAHYFILTNQMGLSPTDIHTVTHAFCYTYAKATRGVSYCAPAYYADRLCDRGRAYLRHWLLNHGPEYRKDRQQGEDEKEFRSRVARELYNEDFWRPHRAMQKYGTNRRNPWHESMDGVMFYL